MKSNVIPDSSFFICFLDDPKDLVQDRDRVRIILAIAGTFTILVVPAVRYESCLERLPVTVKDRVKITEVPGTREDPSLELLRPLLGKGEHEVISCAREHFLIGDNTFLFILDDGLARNLVRRTLPMLTDHMKGTVGFLGHCAIRKVLDRDETINLITIIGGSNFRVDRPTIAAVVAEIKARCG